MTYHKLLADEAVTSVLHRVRDIVPCLERVLDAGNGNTKDTLQTKLLTREAVVHATVPYLSLPFWFQQSYSPLRYLGSLRPERVDTTYSL